MLAPNAKLRKAVTATAGSAGAVLQVLEEARRRIGLAEAEDDGPRPLSSDEGERRSLPGAIAARCWALLLARIVEYLPLVCTRCGEPMHLIAFILDPPVVDRILEHISEPTDAPAVLPARSPPQGELSFDAGVEAAGGEAWPEIAIRPVVGTTAGGETQSMTRSGASVGGLSAEGGGMCPGQAAHGA